jgi:hypothetical protein
MITLTTPAEINSVLGGNTPVAYNKLVLAPFTMDAVSQTVIGTLRLTSTGTPSMQPIIGTVRMNVTTSELLIEVPQLDFYRRIVLSGGQNTAVLNQIESAQAAVENGFITLGVIAGVRTSGA